jgi:hypothetical protein
MDTDNTRDGAEPSHASAGSQRDTFEAAVMNWISEATSLIQWRSDGGRRIMTDACERCWDAANPKEERSTSLADVELDAIRWAADTLCVGWDDLKPDDKDRSRKAADTLRWMVARLS